VPVTINGSPTHVLIVHVVVVLLPLSVLAALLMVAVPAARRAYSLITLVVTFIACIAVPFAFLSGSALRSRLPPTPLIARHVQLAHQLLPIAAAFGVVLAAFVAIDVLQRAGEGQLNALERRAVDATPTLRRYAETRRLGGVGRGGAGGGVFLGNAPRGKVYRVGDAGAKAAWSGRLSSSATAPIK
jgi:hypothetical protein